MDSSTTATPTMQRTVMADFMKYCSSNAINRVISGENPTIAENRSATSNPNKLNRKYLNTLLANLSSQSCYTPSLWG